MKKIYLIIGIVISFLLIGCSKDNTNNYTKCSLKKDENTTFIITISEEDGKVIVEKNENQLTCIDNFCDIGGKEERIEEDSSFEDVVKKYREEGYNCGEK